MTVRRATRARRPRAEAMQVAVSPPLQLACILHSQRRSVDDASHVVLRVSSQLALTLNTQDRRRIASYSVTVIANRVRSPSA